jgi:Sulfotransferase family
MTPKLAPFFVIGASRSGTTLFRLMLNEHPALHVPRESWFLIDLMDKLPLEYPLSREQIRLAFEVITAHWRWKDWDIEDSYLWDRFASLQEPLLSDLIDAVFRLSSEKSGKERWGDKTPEYIRHIDRLHTVFPQAKFIHIIRDGRDVCLSLTRYEYRMGVLSENAKYWAEWVAAGIESGRRLPENLYLEVAYEDVVVNTEQTLREICRFLTVPYDQRMLEFHNDAGRNIASWEMGHHYKTLNPLSSKEVFKWRREMGTLDLIVVEAVAGHTMDRTNQDRVFTRTYRIIPMAYTALNKVTSWSLPLLHKVRS